MASSSSNSDFNPRLQEIVPTQRNIVRPRIRGENPASTRQNYPKKIFIVLEFRRGKGLLVVVPQLMFAAHSKIWEVYVIQWWIWKNTNYTKLLL